MAGKIKSQLNELISLVGKGNQVIINTTKTKLILQGLNPDKYDEYSPDDPIILEKIKVISNDFRVKISS